MTSTLYIQDIETLPNGAKKVVYTETIEPEDEKEPPYRPLVRFNVIPSLHGHHRGKGKLG